MWRPFGGSTKAPASCPRAPGVPNLTRPATTAQFYRRDPLPAPNPTRPLTQPNPTMDDTAVTGRQKRLLGGRRALRSARFSCCHCNVVHGRVRLGPGRVGLRAGSASRPESCAVCGPGGVRLGRTPELAYWGTSGRIVYII